MKLSVLTINIAGFQFGWFEGRRDHLIRGIKKLGPDIVFLQETIISPERHYDQTLDIGKETGLSSSCYTPYGNESEYESPRLGGIGILSRWPFHIVQSRKLPPGVIDAYGARSGLYASISLENKEILLATTHLSYRPEEEKLRSEQVDEFLKGLTSFDIKNIIVGGDLNAVASEPAIRHISSFLQDSGGDGNTFKDRKIDYLFTTPTIKIMNAQIIELPSDHAGVIAQYEI